MMKRNSALLILIVVTGMSSCEKVLDIDLLPEKPLLVLNCSLIADSTWLISLTRSADILDYKDSIARVDNAEITIRNEKNGLVETLENFPSAPPLPIQPGMSIFRPATSKYYYNYRGKTAPVAGQSYSIKVTVEGEPDLYAYSQIPLPVALASVTVDSFRYSPGRDVEMKVSFQDPGQGKNYYQIMIFRESLIVPVIYKSGGPNMPLVIIPDSAHAYIGRSHFRYNTEGLVDEFGSGDSFTDDLFNGKFYELRLRVQNYIQTNPNVTVHVVLVSMNKEYYDYFSSVKLSKEISDNPLLQPVQMYTNIANGLGVFGGFSVSEILLE
jgi:hypothetical protein